MLSWKRFAAVMNGSSGLKLQVELWLVVIVLAAIQLATPTARAQSEPDGMQLRVVGGVPARPNVFPSMVAILVDSGDGKHFSFCGGTIIDPRWVLTAAHCVFAESGKLAAAASFQLVEGTAELGVGGDRLSVDRVVPHADFDRHTMSNDIALLHLAEPAKEQRQILASRVMRETLTHAGTNVTVTGWGTTSEHGSISKKLLQASMPIVPLEQCRKAYPPSPDGEMIHDHNICAGLEQGGVDSCQGDSGGPLFAQPSTLGTVQIGVVSWGAGCARPGKYGVYTSVADFEPFIKQYVPNASLATQSSDAGGTLHEAQPSNMPAPGENAQVNVDVVPAGPVRIGTPVILRVSSSDTGTLMLFTRDAEGHVNQLFPNHYTAANSSALVAGREIRAGATITVPGPADGFRIKAQAPLGETVVIAIVAPPEAKVADLIERHQGLDEIPNWDQFIGELTERLRAASIAKAASISSESGNRALGVEAARPAIAIAERHFTVSQ